MAFPFFKKKTKVKESTRIIDNTPKRDDPEPNEFDDGISHKVTDKIRGAFNRAIGDWPVFDRPPLEDSELRRMFSTRPSFVDHFPFVDFDSEQKVFILDDNISCGAVFSIQPPDMDARTEETIEQFCISLNNALRAMPISDEAPYIIQIYSEDRQPKNIARELFDAAKSIAKESKFTKAWLNVMEEHFSMMSNPLGIFADDRTDGSKGWRAIERKITMVVFRKAPKNIWQKDKRLTSFEQFNRSIETFIQQLSACGCQLERFNENDLFNWLTPWFNPDPAGNSKGSVVDWLDHNQLKTEEENKGAAWDLAQMICPEPPRKVNEFNAERGIMKFGNQYSKFITMQPIFQTPKPGCFTTDTITQNSVLASLWDRMPAETMMVWTIIPLSSHEIDSQLDRLGEKAGNSASRHAKMVYEQVNEAKDYLMSGKQSIFHFQVGAYLRADTVDTLDERYYAAIALLDNVQAMRSIHEEYDLFPTDSYIRNMPFVYSWEHDRRNALRSAKAYTAHIAATLPLYGRSRGSKNACFINYNRSGEIIRINPYHKEDKSRVAHSGLFGPTGAGKSATQVAQSMQSMAINFPRQFFIDKGGSFSLLGDYYESMGLKVRRINFQTSTDVCMPPFAETEMALKQNRGELVYEEDTDEEEKRDYLAEMFQAAILMITGGNKKSLENLNNQDRSFIQEGIIKALELSKERNQKHARPSDLVECLKIIAARERNDDLELGRKINQLADSVNLWTQGTRGHFFDRYGTGFSDEDDVVILELGVLTSASSEDMLAVAMTALISAITQMGEKHQSSGREIEVYMDECHYVTANPLLVDSVVVGVKVWRKISIWLNLSTQNITDFPDHANKILDLIEFWWLLTMKPTEASRIQEMLQLSDESQYLIKQCKKNAPFYVEGVMLSDKFPSGTLLRLVPPALALALGMTDGDEKKKIQDIVDLQKISRLDAAIQISREIIEKRKTFSPGYTS